jgi:hypothetical protein
LARVLTALVGAPDNVQPYLEIGVRLLKDAGPLSSLVVAPGIWANWISGCASVDESVGLCISKTWEATDPYVKLTATWWEIFSTTVSYTYYSNPYSFTSSGNGEVGLSFYLNDSKWLGAFALNPNLLFAFDYATERTDTVRIYMGLGFAPGYTFLANSGFPVNVSLPMTFGISIKNFYTTRTVEPFPCPGFPQFQCSRSSFQNQTFGYFSGGPLISMPLKFLPASLGNWTGQGGVQFLVLNSALAAQRRDVIPNRAGNFVPIGSVGLSLTY